MIYPQLLAMCNVISLSTIFNIFWISSASAILIMTLILMEKSIYIPKLLKESFFVGKLKTKFLKHPDTTWLSSIPKKWFLHFYIIGFIVQSFLMVCLILHLNGFHGFLNKWMLSSSLSASSLKDTDSKWLSSLIVLSLEWFQICRRLYECLFISSFSKSTMSVIHYFYGVFLYSTFGIGLLMSTGIGSVVKTLAVSYNDLVYISIGILLFGLSSYGQHKSLVIFASLRQKTKGNSPEGHYIPQGFLFEFVSSPHYLFESMIYFTFCYMFHFANMYLNSVFMFVLINQLASGLMVHDWYRKTFQNYPLQRKAVIPYIL